MNTYRSYSIIQAVQFTGAPIEGVTCSGSDKDYREKGCDNSRRHLTHVHSAEVGGMTVLRVGDWIFPVFGGPFGVASDEKFRGHWEVSVPANEPAAQQPAVTEPGEVPPVPEPDKTPAFAEFGLLPTNLEDVKVIDDVPATSKQEDIAN